MVVVDIAIREAVGASYVVGADVDGIGVYWEACFIGLVAFVAVCRVRDGVFHFVMGATA